MKKTFNNLSLLYNLTKDDNKKFFFIYLILIPLLCIISVILPLFAASQIVYINDTVFNQLLYVSITVLILSVVLNIIKYISDTTFNTYFKESIKVLRIKVLDNIKGKKKIKENEILEVIDELEIVIPKMISSTLEIIINIGLLLTILFINVVMFIFLLAGAALIFEIKTMYDEKDLVDPDKDIKILKLSINKYIKSKSIKKSLKDKALNEIENNIEDVNNIKFDNEVKKNRFDLLNNSIVNLLNFLLIIVGIKLLKKNLINVASFITVFIYKDRIFKMVDSYIYLTSISEYFNESSDKLISIINK